MSPRPDRSPIALILGGVTVLAGLLAASVVVDELRWGVDGLGPSPFYAVALLVLGGWVVFLGLGGGRRGASTGRAFPAGWIRAAVQLGAAVLIVFPVLSISTASPGCACRNETARLKSDLRNLASAQEVYFGNGNYTYASSLHDLEGHRGRPFGPSEGVLLAVREATPLGYAALAVSVDGPGIRCVMYVGKVEERPRTFAGSQPREPTVPVCDPPRRGFEFGFLPGGLF